MGKSKDPTHAARSGFVRAVTLACILAWAGCAATPAERFDATAARLGLERDGIAAGAHVLRTFRRPADTPAGTTPARLNVYLDGDGRPFVRPGRVARDPTPVDPLALHLLIADRTPALYLGRPCYHATSGPCPPALWTVERYGESVVSSLADGVRTLAARYPETALVLIGYSGGGTLALLVAARVPEVAAVVTIAANLDTAAWTAHHGYSPLVGSFNPAIDIAAGSLPASLHFRGARDTQVPPATQRDFAARFPDAAFRTIEEFGHRCCWVDAWPRLQAEIDIWLRAATEARTVP